jgi:hypothetical protein
MCTGSSRAFEIVKDPGLLDLLDTFATFARLDPSLKAKEVMPHPTTVSRNVHYLAVEVQDNIRKHLSQWIEIDDGIAFATDMYTQPNTYVL